MVWCSLSVAKVSSYHQGAVKMLYAIMMSFCYSPRHDIRTDPRVVFPLLHSDIFIYLFDFVLLSLWNSAFQNTMFSPLSDLMKSLCLFPPSFSSFQIPPSSPLSLLFLSLLTVWMQQLPRRRCSSSAEDLDSQRLR